MEETMDLWGIDMKNKQNEQMNTLIAMSSRRGRHAIYRTVLILEKQVLLKMQTKSMT